MRALVGGVGRDWVMRDVPVPEAGAGEVLVRVRAAGLNRADLLMLQGIYPGTRAEFTAGSEVAGEVAAVGAGVTGLAEGARVMGGTRGAFAEYALVDRRRLMPVPEALDWAEAAALPVGLETEHDALVQAGFTAGQSVVVLGATSSVGLVGVQLAKALGATPVVATTTSARKAAALAGAGADLVVNTADDDLAEAVTAATGGTGADIVLDHVGGQAFAAAFLATRIGGTIVNIGRLAGPESTVDLNDLAFRRLRVIGTTFSVRTQDERAAVTAALVPDVLPALSAGRIRPVIDRVVPFTDATAAADHMRSNQAVGKIVLSMV